MKGPSPAFPLYARDWIVDTARLPLAAQGAYIRLLCHEWVEGSLPCEQDDLARICGIAARKEWAVVWTRLKPLFVVEGGSLVNRRLEGERAKQIAFREERSRRGTEGAKKRWTMAQAMPEPMPKLSPVDGRAVASHLPLHETPSERLSNVSRTEGNGSGPQRMTEDEFMRLAMAKSRSRSGGREGGTT